MDSTVTKDHTQHYPSKEDPETQDSDERPFKGLKRDTFKRKAHLQRHQAIRSETAADLQSPFQKGNTRWSDGL